MWSKADQTAVGGFLFHDGPDHLQRETVSPSSFRFVAGSNLLSSYFAKGNHRIHFGRAACWEIARQRGHCK
jgi:hypothetical protein